MVLEGKQSEVIAISLHDPVNLSQAGYPTKKAVLYVRVSREHKEMVNDNSRPTSLVVDDAILEMALDAPFSDEKDCHIVSERNCSRCGSGLGFVSCPQCGGDFQDGQSCTVWGTPLSLKMVKFLLGLGYKFIIDPAEGQEEEQRQFEESMRLLEAKKD